MESSTTGRRHHRTGSIPVSDLIQQQQPYPIRIKPRQERENEELAAELLAADEHITVAQEAPRRQLKKSTKLLICLAGATLLTSCVLSAAAITSSNWAKGSGSAALAKTVAMNGSVVLRPDLLSAELAKVSGLINKTASPAVSANNELAAPLPSSSSAQSIRSAQHSAIPRPPAFGLDTPLGVIQEFYRRVRDQPDQAIALVAPHLLGDPVAFVRSWRELRAVRVVETKDRRDGSVLAVVDLQRADGGWLHTRQVLFLAPAESLRITRAELVSAQRG